VAVLSQDELFSALAVGGDFASLLGTPETDWLDFKKIGYPLDEKRGKWDLARDVAALANAQGGCLVLGVETAQQTYEIADVAVRIRPIAKATINPDRYLDVVKTSCYPQPRGVRCRWFPPDPDAEDGLFVIELPGQLEADRPYLATRMVDEGGKEFEAFVVPRREGARVVSLSPGEVHRLLGDGHRRRSFPDLSSPAADDRADRVIATIEGAQGWAELPVYWLQALPPPGDRARLADFYGSTGPGNALIHIDLLRPSGFNLRVQGDVGIRDGAITYLGDPRRAIWVEPDGQFTTAAVASADYLGGGADASNRGLIRLNPVAVVEWTLEFFRFLVGHIWQAAGSSPGWTCRVVCRRFVSCGPVALARGLPSPPSGFDPVAMPASTDQWCKIIEVGGEPAVDAFNGLVELYALFGQPDSSIPLSEGGRVSQQKLFAIRG
jgi:hypothetical protein